MQRREMLKAGLAAGTGVLLLPQGDCAAEAGKGELQVAVIGIGLQGRALISAALMMPEVRFRAVCDVWDYACRYGESYLGNYGHKVVKYTDYREMLDQERGLHAVLIASPDFVHAEQTNACLKAGLHVYCETLMSNTLDGARSMVQTMRSTGKLLQIGYQRRSNPRYLHVRDKLLGEAKLTDKTTHVTTLWQLAIGDDRGWPRKDTIPDERLKRHGYGSMREFRNWRWFRKYCGGLFGNLGSHQLDVMLWFLNATPTSVAATGSHDHDPASQWNKDVMALYELSTPEGPLQSSSQMLTSTRGDGSTAYELFSGTQASIRISQNPRWTAVFRDPDAPDWEDWLRREYLKTAEQQRSRRSERAAAEVVETGEVETYQLPVELDKPPSFPHLKNFFDASRGQAQLACPADLAFSVEVMAAKTVQAVTSRQLVTFKPEDFVV